MVWLLSLVLVTAKGPIDVGLLHNKQGLVRFKSQAECEEMRVALTWLAQLQASQGKLNPEITGAQLTCFQPKAA